MKPYQRRAIKLASNILAEMNKPKYRVCPVCGKPTNDIDYGDGDRYGPVYHSNCYRKRSY